MTSPAFRPPPVRRDSAQSSYERYAAHYAGYRLHACPDDRADVLASLDLARATHVAEIGYGPGYYASVIAASHPTLAVTGIDNAPAQRDTCTIWEAQGYRHARCITPAA